MRDPDAGEEKRAEELRNEYREQREAFTYLLEQLLDPTQSQTLSAALLEHEAREEIFVKALAEGERE